MQLEIYQLKTSKNCNGMQISFGPGTLSDLQAIKPGEADKLTQGRFVSNTEYYNLLKKAARETREKSSLTSSTVSLSTLRDVYKAEGIRIDYWPYKLRKIRGAYLIIGDQPCVLINERIKPKEPRIFVMAHELKHHLVDHELAKRVVLGCQEVSWSEGSTIEIGAEIFASELIYPEEEFVSQAKGAGLEAGKCQAADVVLFKRICPAPVSYSFLVKRLEWFGFIRKGEFSRVQFQKLEESMFGVPYFRRKRA